jgi:hypothetical protein
MTPQPAFATLCTQLEEMLRELRQAMITVGDRPLTGDVVLVDALANRIEDLSGWVAEALAAAVAGRDALDAPVDIVAARGALATCHEQFGRILKGFATDPISDDTMRELSDFGEQRGGEWGAWTNGMREALSRCVSQVFDANDALAACWVELAEAAGGAGVPTISVQTGNITQHPERPPAVTRSRAREAEEVPHGE